jgi:hypothetical protein
MSSLILQSLTVSSLSQMSSSRKFTCYFTDVISTDKVMAELL